MSGGRHLATSAPGGSGLVRRAVADVRTGHFERSLLTAAGVQP
jgi:hypothetical protein